jgi:ribosome biogenesis GTPase A
VNVKEHDQQEAYKEELTKTMLKAYKQAKKEGKDEVKIAVVGYPNVGKSSLVNFLRQANATMVGPEPGTTKATQEVVLDKKIVLYDCPGVIPKSEDDMDGLVLRQAIKASQLQDAVAPVSDLLQKVQVSDVCKLYHIA